jgi:hypothetical protein
LKIFERQDLRFPSHALMECKCCVCGALHDFRNDEIKPREGPVCPQCLGPMVLIKVKGR